MIDTKELMKKIMSVKDISEEQARRIVDIVDERLRAKQPVTEEKLYTDEPIRPELFKKPQQRTEQNDTALARIAAMRRIAFEPGNRGTPPEEIFFRQAKFMADFEDDYVPAAPTHGDFRRQELGLYFRGFSTMPTSSLRVYYTWRTRLKKGDLTRTEFTNAFIYAMELIHCIGFDTADEAYAALHSFIDDYSALDYRIRNFGRKWLKDFIIYYGLDRSLLESSRQFPDSVEKLAAPQEASDEELFAALTSNSSYSFDRSRFYKQHPEATARVVCKVYRAAMEDDPDECLKRYVGTRNELNYDLFGAAMFCGRSSHGNYSYEADRFCRYVCRDGKWFVDMLTRTGKQTAALGSLLKNTECLLRKRMKFASQLKPVDLTEKTAELINRAIAGYFAEQREAEKQKIRFDFAKLDSIRSSADETAELLLAESEGAHLEELPTQSPAVFTEQPAQKDAAPAQEPQNTEPVQEQPEGIPELTEAEKTLIKCLANGTDYKEKLRKLSVLPSIAADSVNEKFMEIFLDTVIADNGSGLEIIEDYLEELKGIAVKL